MIYREILDPLKKWMQKRDRKPLVLRGARQVGKTTVVTMLAKEFDRFIHLNLERPGEAVFFKHDLPVKQVLQSILLSKNIGGLENGRTLLFIDEIQGSPSAIEALRYFYEEIPGLHVIAAGSLLEAMIEREQLNFPVGRVEFLCMYPLRFSEYLRAINEDAALMAYNEIPFPSYAYDTLLRHYHQYTQIGGMPEVVDRFAKTRDVLELHDVYQSLLTSLIDDVPKYARNRTQAAVIRHCIEAIPFEIGKRIAFAGFGKSNYRSREIGEALRTLERAMLAYLLYPTTSTELPVAPDLRKAPRIQFLDTGLINYYAGLQHQYFSMDSLHSLYKGVIAEHITAQELIAAISDMQRKPCFWVRESAQANAEVDFVLPYRDKAIPVEVKAGPCGKLRSLHEYMNRCPHDMAVRLYAGPLDVAECTSTMGKKFRLLSLPYFLVSKIADHLDWAFGAKTAP